MTLNKQLLADVVNQIVTHPETHTQREYPGGTSPCATGWVGLITLKNDFHDTSTRAKLGHKTANAVKLIKRRLCASAGCTCSDDLGTRGDQQQPSGGTVVIDPAASGGVVLSLQSE